MKENVHCQSTSNSNFDLDDVLCGKHALSILEGCSQQTEITQELEEGGVCERRLMLPSQAMCSFLLDEHNAHHPKDGSSIFIPLEFSFSSRFPRTTWNNRHQNPQNQYHPNKDIKSGDSKWYDTTSRVNFGIEYFLRAPWPL